MPVIPYHERKKLKIPYTQEIVSLESFHAKKMLRKYYKYSNIGSGWIHILCNKMPECDLCDSLLKELSQELDELKAGFSSTLLELIGFIRQYDLEDSVAEETELIEYQCHSYTAESRKFLELIKDLDMVCLHAMILHENEVITQANMNSIIYSHMGILRKMSQKIMNSNDNIQARYKDHLKKINEERGLKEGSA